MRRRTFRFLVKAIFLTTFCTLGVLLLTGWLSSKELTSKLNRNYERLKKSPYIWDQIKDQKNNEIDETARQWIPNLLNDDKKDWQDWTVLRKDLERVGLGEGGKVAHLNDVDKTKEKQIFSQNGFNALLSDSISVNRSLTDLRNIKCRDKKYLSKLPKASVIFIFYNEHFGVLLRSIYSVINRSPPELLEEIILVDDFSDRENLKQKLDDYVAEYLPKVKIVRLSERTGLIGARMAGARNANGEVLIFFDSHIEAGYNFLPPLLEPIALNYRTSVCPFIDVIDHTTFELRAQDEGARGAFDWEFYYKRLPLLPEDLIDKTKPFRSPIMAGGLFAISTKFFWEVEGYDDGLDIWGGEQYELSFKIWMCGGELLDAPCSRVAHIYRGPMVSKNPRKTDYVHKNYKRVAEVWMDEYKEYLYEHNPGVYKRIDPGDLTKQKALRERLQCKSFKWFMEEIAFDLIKHYPPVEPPDYAYGTVQSLADPTLCLDSMSKPQKSEIGLYPCAEDHLSPQRTQFWSISWHKDLRLKFGKNCLDVASSKKNAPALLWECHKQGGNQLWFYDIEQNLLQQGKWREKCLEADIPNRRIFVNRCDENNTYMKWRFGYANKTALANYKTEQ